MSQDARRVDASAVPGARPALSPGFIEPCHPTLRDKAPSGLRWIHEIKFDGYRTQAHLRNKKPAIYTRRAYDWTRRFQTIADALATLPANDLILDGEAVVADSRGVPDFALLHADLAAGRQDRLVYCAFDLLYLDGFDLRGAQLLERKRLLVDLLADASERILYAEHLEGDGPEIHERAWHEPTQSRSRGASSQPLGSGTRSPPRRTSAPGTSSSTTYATVAARRPSARGRRGRGQDSQSRPR
jgi:bifunctional non-homologous end joining protein LigD